MREAVAPLRDIALGLRDEWRGWAWRHPRNVHALALGPVIGGLLISSAGWRSVFLLNVPLILLGLALCRGHVQESCARSPDSEGHDVYGLVLLIVSLLLLLLTIGLGPKWGWHSARTLGTATAGALLVVLLVQVERHARYPLIRVDLFTRPSFFVAALASMVLAFFYCAAFFLMPLYLHNARHQGSAAIGWLLLPSTAVMALVSPFAGRWADSAGTRAPLVFGFLALALSALLQARFDAGPGWTMVTAAFAFMGLGWGLILGPSTVAALSAVPVELGGLATGAAWTLHNVGGALGLTIATMVFSAARLAAGPLVGGAPEAGVPAFLAGYHASMGVLVVITLSMATLLLSAPSTNGSGKT